MRYGIANRIGQPDTESARRIIATAWKGGIRFFDTAQDYGVSENIVGQVFQCRGFAGEAHVITKLSASLSNASIEEILTSIRFSLKQLHVLKLWAILLHDENHLDRWNGSMGAAMRQAREKGLTDHIGVSIYSPSRALQAMEISDIDVLQVPANLFDRRMQRAEVFTKAAARDVTVFIRSIYLQGLALFSSQQAKETAPFAFSAVTALEQFCRSNGLDQKRFAFEYARGFSSEALRIVGAETPEQVVENSRLENEPPLDSALFRQWDKVWPDDVEELVNPSQWPAVPPIKTMKTLAIIQARMGSIRLPNKVMRPINGKPMIELLLSRLAKARRIDRIILATSDDPRNQPLADHVRSLGYDVFQGSENDVLNRYYQAAKYHHPDTVVRITGDCPLIDPELVDQVIAEYETQGVDYLSNSLPPTYPDGLDTEVFSFRALEQAFLLATKPFEREHVTPFLRESPLFKRGNFAYKEDFSKERWTVDEAADFEVVTAVFNHFHPRTDFSWLEVLALKQSHPTLFQANQNLSRNEGSTLGAGQKLWKRAKWVIPGGNMLLSKRAEMFLPEKWPTYFSRAKGCHVWDLDGRELLDMCIMGIGTNTLGYGHPEVDEAVRQVIEKGNMSTLNCPEEVLLAEKLVAMHPWADMARFARTGGEANAIAVRIGRAASGRDEVAFCGYHGWHDWYLAANLPGEGALASHLLPGLEPKGVPRSLSGTIHPFTYNDMTALEKIVNQHPVGVIVMEVVRNLGPENDFLHRVRELATRKGIVLMFDECTSGFRQTFGGIHKQFGVEPDMAMFGKALGNGYAITAVIGRRGIMEHAQDTFISSTFWTERIGPAAALKTLEVMEQTRSWEKITATGAGITRRWQSLAQTHGLKLETGGLSALTWFAFPGPNALAYKTLITQELLKKNILAANSVYVCTEHSPELIDIYFDALEPVFALIRECEDGRDVAGLLEGPVCQSGFKRLN
jgi:glutamate-1-semialdehyde 2,1-aminomutase